jgi:hypothetical protein
MKMLFCILACFANTAFAISVAVGHAAPAAHASVSAHSSPHVSSAAAHGTPTAHATAEAAPAARSTSSTTAAHPVETVPSRPWYMFWRSPVFSSSSSNKCDKDKDPNCK